MYVVSVTFMNSESDRNNYVFINNEHGMALNRYIFYVIIII